MDNEEKLGALIWCFFLATIIIICAVGSARDRKVEKAKIDLQTAEIDRMIRIEAALERMAERIAPELPKTVDN